MKALARLSARVYQTKRCVPSLDVHRRVGVGTTFGREVLQREAVVHQRLFDGRLMKRGVHRFAETQVAETVSRSVHADRRSVDDDADGLGPAHEQPRLGVGRGQATYSIGSNGPRRWDLSFGI